MCRLNAFKSRFIILLLKNSFARFELSTYIKGCKIEQFPEFRAGNSLIGFLSESLVFCPKMSEWAIRSKKWAIHSFAHFWWATWVIRSRLLILSHFLWATWANRSWSLNFWWATWAIRSNRSFLVSDLSTSLTSLTKKKEMIDSLMFSKKKFKNRI